MMLIGKTANWLYVRGVGGSCIEHLTIESYTVIISLLILIIICIPSPTHCFTVYA